ncbi:hypothetical protein COOONC_28681 [Cooperia oncophora]
MIIMPYLVTCSTTQYSKNLPLSVTQQRQGCLTIFELQVLRFQQKVWREKRTYYHISNLFKENTNPQWKYHYAIPLKNNVANLSYNILRFGDSFLCGSICRPTKNSKHGTHKSSKNTHLPTFLWFKDPKKAPTRENIAAYRFTSLSFATERKSTPNTEKDSANYTKIRLARNSNQHKVSKNTTEQIGSVYFHSQTASVCDQLRKAHT